MNEWGSTKTCNFCEQRGLIFTPGKRHLVCRECVEALHILPPVTLFRKIDVCTNDFRTVPFVQPPLHIPGSPRTMDRDENGARNILTIGVCNLLGVQLPDALNPSLNAANN